MRVGRTPLRGQIKAGSCVPLLSPSSAHVWMLGLSTITATLTVLQISRWQQLQDPAAAAAPGYSSTLVQAPAVGYLPAAEDYAQEPQHAAKIPYPLWWHAPFYSGTGYSTEAISYIASLIQSNLFRKEDVWISHAGDQISESVAGSLDRNTVQILKDQEYNRLSRGVLPAAELNRPAVAVCHTFPDCWFLPKDSNDMMVPGCPCPSPDVEQLIVYKVGRTMFETNGLPQHLVEHCSTMDEIWVPTDFNRQTFAAAGVPEHKLHVVPEGIDGQHFDPDKYEPLVLRDLPEGQLITGRPWEDAAGNAAEDDPVQPYVFMSVFKWEARKGWDILLEAYLLEFTAEEPVELHIMTKPFGKGNSNFREQVLVWLQRKLKLLPRDVTNLPRVFVHTRHVDDATYPRLYLGADCVVLPTRGEGWGRPQMEAMAMGRPLITTNWSGPTAYINDQVAYPLAIDGLSSAEEDMNATSLSVAEINAYFRGQLWAKPSVVHLKQLMRQVFTQPQEASAKGRAARRHIQQHFAPTVLAQKIKEEVLRIEQLLGADRTLTPVEQRQEARSTKALCMNFPDLCKQGPLGIAEAASRAQSSFSHFRASAGSSLVAPGRMTVEELIAYNRKALEEDQKAAKAVALAHVAAEPQRQAPRLQQHYRITELGRPIR